MPDRLLQFFAVLMLAAFATLVYVRIAYSQECCPVTQALIAVQTAPSPSLPPAPRGYPIAYPIAYPIGYPYAYPYQPVYRGQLYEFTGYMVNGQPIYRTISW